MYTTSSGTKNTISMVDAHLEMDPDDVIEFVLDTPISSSNNNNNNQSQKVTLVLKNLDPDALPIAFKV